MSAEDDLLERLRRARPSDVESARRAVEPFRDMTVAERMEAFTQLLRDMDVFLAGRDPIRSPDHLNFWKHWKDPMYGRPR